MSVDVELRQAAEAGDLFALRRAIAAGASLESTDTLGRTALHLALWGRHEDSSLELIVAGADVNAQDFKSSRPLHLASGLSMPSVVAALLQVGADPSAMDSGGFTPLHAALQGRVLGGGQELVRVIDLLLDAGIPIDAPENAGRTALWFAASYGAGERPESELKVKLAALEHLLERGADPHVQAQGRLGTPIDAAHGRHNDPDIARAWPAAIERLES